MRRPSPLILQRRRGAGRGARRWPRCSWWLGAAPAGRWCVLAVGLGRDSRASTSSISTASRAGRQRRSTTPVPEGSGPWRRGVLGALPPRAHARGARARPRAHDRALPERRRGDSRRHGRARRRATASSGRTRARSRCSGSTSAQDIGAPLDEPRAPAGVRPLPRGRRLLAIRSSSIRSATPASRSRSRSCRSASRKSC